MTIAEYFNNTIPAVQENGFRDHLTWQITVQHAESCAIDTEVLCPESHDSSVLLTFHDNSRLRIDNPRQSAFCGQITIVNGEV